MNNTGILQKCLDELSKEAPRLDYVRGILETLIDSQAPDGWVPVTEESKVTRTKINETREAAFPIDSDLPPMPDLNKIRAAATQEML